MKAEELASDAAFERMLLESARSDVLPEAVTQQAWTKFASAAGVLATGAAAKPGGGSGGQSLLAGDRRSPLQWLALGALGGSLATGVWMALTQPTHPPARPASAVVLAPSAAAPLLASPPPVAPAPSPPPPFHGSRQPRASSSLPRPSAPPQLAAASTLAAEVKALDAVRTAIDMGAFPSALQLIEEFHRTFPRGQLSSDAEALAIDALMESGNTREAERRGARFVSRYPGDPHAARIQSVVDGLQRSPENY